jgi:hypothetical protein
MVIIRGTQQDTGDTSPEAARAPLPAPDALQVRAGEVFADDVADGRIPSIRAIRARLHVGQPRAQLIRAHLAVRAEGGYAGT